MAKEHQGARTRSPYKSKARVPCIGFRCVRPARRVLILLGENSAELEFAARAANVALGTLTHFRSADAREELGNDSARFAGFCRLHYARTIVTLLHNYV